MIDYFNIEIVRERIIKFFLSFGAIGEFFIESRRIVLIYIGVLLILLLIAAKMQKSYFRVLQKYVLIIDELLYRLTQTVYDNKDDIVRYNEAKALLFGGKMEIIKSDKKNYIENQEKIKQDVQYAETFLNTELMNSDEWAKIARMRRFVKRTHALYGALTGVLSVMTIGLYRLGHKRLHY